MRTTVEELIKELQQCDPKAFVVVSTGNGTSFNHVQRIDRGVALTTIVVGQGA